MWTERLRTWMRVPEGLSDLPFKGAWKGVAKHSGPDRYTPLKKSLAFKHVSGLYTLLSGSLVWMSSRLATRTDTQVLDELGIALFCYQQDHRYYRAPDTRPSQADVDAADRFSGPVLFILDQWHDHRSRSNAMWPVHPPHNMLGALLEMTRYVVGAEARPALDAWIAETTARLSSLVPFPGHSAIPQKYAPEVKHVLAATSMGRPLPPHVLDRNTEPSPSNFSAQWEAFLKSVEWQHNRFLRSPQELAVEEPSFVAYEQSR